MATKIVQRTSKYRNYIWGSWILAIIGLIVLPYIQLPEVFGNSVGQLQNWNRVLAYAVGILGLNLLLGYSGQISIGHSAFVGIGAYTTIILVADHHWSYFAALPAAFLMSFIVGCIVGLPALRIKGLYLVVVTFAMAIAFPTVIVKYESLTGGSNGKGAKGTLEPPAWTPFDPARREDPIIYRYFVLLIVAAVMFLLARNMIKSRAGRALIAQRDNPLAAAINGVAVPVNKVIVFGLSAAYGGVAGWMLMVAQPFASDIPFGAALSITMIIGLVMGGAATVSGAIPGAVIVVIVQFLLEHLTSLEKLGPFSLKWLSLRSGKGGIVGMVFGVLLLVFVFVMPGGVIDGLRRIRARFVQIEPNPAWLDEVGPGAAAE